MAANGCAHDRFHENSRQETVCLDCGLPLEEVLQEWLASLPEVLMTCDDRQGGMGRSIATIK